MKNVGRNSVSLRNLQAAFRRLGRAKKAQLLQRFFKTGPGEYGAGDRFLGIMVPQTRALVGRASELPVERLRELLRSSYHEERLLALLTLVRQFERGNDVEKKRVFHEYCRNLRWVNNWDLVDLSAPYIVGSYLASRSRKCLYRLAASPDLWRRRVAIVATLSFIRDGAFDDTLRITEMLLGDERDLLHKACGWMLREVGKRNRPLLKKFLKKHLREMPRTMLRYAIEHFPEAERKVYLRR